MILFFSGTGNSRYIARRLAAALGDELVSVNDRIKSGDTGAVRADGRLIFVTPTYGWRIPRVVEEWIRRVEFSGADKVWFVMNCGSEIGNAAKYNKRLCADKGFTYMGTAQVIMPENYIAMFDAPEAPEAARIIEAASPSIDEAARKISEGFEFAAPQNNLYDRFMSTAVNPAFYALFVKADKFRADDKCIGCGKCARLACLCGAKTARTAWPASVTARRAR